jgi:membrane-associated phospholipid phosphatase
MSRVQLAALPQKPNQRKNNPPKRTPKFLSKEPRDRLFLLYNKHMNFFRNIFYKIGSNIATLYSGWNLLWQLLAFVFTYILVVTGFVWTYFNYFHASWIYPYMIWAGLVGFAIPVFLPIILLIVGRVRKNSQIKNTGYALAQAAFLGWCFSSFYKVFSGRVAPPGFNQSLIGEDISRLFKIGIYRGGIFWGWPSSHTTVAFAVSVTLLVLFSENKWVKLLAWIFALYVGIGASMTFHWFSDFAAGVIFGTLIGLTVGQTFKK